jgi:hypothetical protein
MSSTLQNTQAASAIISPYLEHFATATFCNGLSRRRTSMINTHHRRQVRSVQ